MHIRIISTPPGEAPEHVRAAWVGLVLPLAVSGAHTRHGVGVLSGPKTWLGQLVACLSGKTERQRGYIVDASHAIEMLAAHAPDAATWWRENAAASIRPGKRLLFPAEACQEVTA
jgi:hypothetical protein